MGKNNTLTKGISYDLISRLIFISVGYALNIFLARYLGPSKYGYIAIVLSVLTIINVFLTNGVRQTISEFLSQATFSPIKIWRSALIAQSIICCILVILFAVLAKPFALLLGETSLYKYFLLILFVIPFNGIYFLQIGLLNGLQKFKEQSICTSVYSLTRFITIAFIILLFNVDVTGVILGTIVAYLTGFFARFFFVKRLEHKGSDVSWGNVFKNSLKYLHLFSLITLLLNVDIFIQQKILNDKALTGVYGAISNFSRFSYFLFFSVTSTIFPIITKLWKEQRMQEIKEKTLRLYGVLVILSLAIFSIVESFSELIIKIVYGTDYLGGVQYMGVYTFAVCLLSINVYLSNIVLIKKKTKLVFLSMWSSLLVYITMSFSISKTMDAMAVPFSFLVCQLMLQIVLLMEQSDKSAFLKRFGIFSLSAIVFVLNSVLTQIDILPLLQYISKMFIVLFVLFVALKLDENLYLSIINIVSTKINPR